VSSTSGSNPSLHAKTVVLDRDGTLVVDRDYLEDPDGLEFLPGAAEALRRLHEGGYRLIVISNQSGVGRGRFSLERMQQINTRLRQMVHAAGAELAGIYCCPHRPDEGCACRKPGTALLLLAARELDFDPRATIVIGDKTSDVELGRRVGAVTMLIGNAIDRSPRATPAADYVVPDLAAAARLIERLQDEPAAGARGHTIA
jgi:D-glycero-D-manno-heptose 1,7-bisphosphate phosphatase